MAAVLDFDALSEAELRARRSFKWTRYPADVLPAFVAEMDVALAPPVAAALQAAVARGDCGYAAPLALPAAYAGFAQRRFGWSVDPAWISAVPDVMIGIVEVLRRLTGAGDPVAINPPIYPPFYAALRETGRPAVEVPLGRDADGRFELDLDALEAAFAGGVRTYLLCNPHNPVGRAYPREQLDAIAALAARHGVFVISDEIHAPLALPGATHTPFPLVAQRHGTSCVVLTSASKAWNVAGLKCAVLIAGDAPMQQRLRALPPEIHYRTGHLGVIASTAAFTEGDAWLDALLAHLDRNRRLLATLLAEELPAIRYVPPEAGFLAWLDCAPLGFSAEPAATFLERGRVAFVPGAQFGAAYGSFVRLNFATTQTLVHAIVARMRAST